MPQPIGYSAAGKVVAVGAGIDDISVGDRCACAGAQAAFHAEIIRVPRNLAVKLPAGLDYSEASTVTLGTIALQGVRRAQPTLGETFIVIGLGVLGQLTVQLLKQAGCRVIGSDTNPSRMDLATKLGMDHRLETSEQALIQALNLTRGIGADGIIVTASTKSDKVIEFACKMSRPKGRVVIVGDVGMKINRADIYKKELDVLISCSYGPGRYDSSYEEGGLDYPISYVRWTENRNMEEYVALLSEKKINLQPLIKKTYPVEDAGTAYSEITSGSSTDGPIALLRYRPEEDEKRVWRAPPLNFGKSRESQVAFALIGVGNFAVTTHIPNLRKLSSEASLRAICSRQGHVAASIAQKTGAKYHTTNIKQILEDPDIDAIIIATRHDLHADFAEMALAHKKHVYVEKPLAISRKSLVRLKDLVSTRAQDPMPVLMTGFNRQFAPATVRIGELLKSRTAPLTCNYVMNAGYIDNSHWVHGPEGGGRNLGEACHIYHLFANLTSAQPTKIQVQSISGNGHFRKDDNFIASISWSDGSVSSLTYSALGSIEAAKEEMTLFSDGVTILNRNYKHLEIYGGRAGKSNLRFSSKGHLESLGFFISSIKNGTVSKRQMEEQFIATEIALEVEALLNTGRVVG
jgi:predicted dehydrogenase/threonine dehydrogenase-like Zn-dependent dehydrogenase